MPCLPGWLAKRYPEVMTPPQGQNKYGPRQKRDIASPVYRYYAERIIRQVWQVELVKQYRLVSQFITHNFDFVWRNGSFGLRAEVDHVTTSRLLDVTGVNVYQPGQSRLTGAEIA
ncbi:beta-galactosidase [Pantoea sp. T14]|uniref:beta-galactosidase n=1 Tax=Pantoea sp. T14 TaxID=3085685 RepID=UPI002FC76C51